MNASSLSTWLLTLALGCAAPLQARAEARCSSQGAEGEHPCHPSIGMLKAPAAGGGFELCTATWVEEGLILTNRHCLPRSMQRKGASCRSVSIDFPKIEGPEGRAFEARSVPCDKVAQVSPESTVGTASVPDYAVLKVQGSLDRPEVPIERNGISNDAALTSFRIHPISPSKGIGEIRKADCTTRVGSALLPRSEDGLASVFAVSGCYAPAASTSGSPLLNASGRLVGLLHGSVAAGSLAKLSKEIGVTLEPLHIATAGHCLDGIDPTKEAAPDCRERNPQLSPEKMVEARLSIEAARANLSDAFTRKRKEWEKDKPRSLFAWKWKRLEDSRKLSSIEMELAPICMRIEESTPTDLRSLMDDDETVSFDASFARATLPVEYDPYLRIKMKTPSFSEAPPIRFTFAREEVLRRKGARVKWSKPGIPGPKGLIAEKDLRRCSGGVNSPLQTQGMSQ